MAKGTWKLEVATLLEQCATLLRARQDLQAIAIFGTAIGYLQRASDETERSATALLAQAKSTQSEDRTKRVSCRPESSRSSPGDN